jgi:hypothetical protein
MRLDEIEIGAEYATRSAQRVRAVSIDRVPENSWTPGREVRKVRVLILDRHTGEVIEEPAPRYMLATELEGLWADHARELAVHETAKAGRLQAADALTAALQTWRFATPEIWEVVADHWGAWDVHVHLTVEAAKALTTALETT